MEVQNAQGAESRTAMTTPPSFPPGARIASVGGGVSITGALGWIVYMLLQLQSGQAQLDMRLQAIESRLPPPRPFVVGSGPSAPPAQKEWAGNP